MSACNGHAIIADIRTPVEFDPYLDRLGELPFVKRVEVRPEGLAGEKYAFDGMLHLTKPNTEIEKFVVEVKRTFLDRAVTNGLIALHRRFVEKHKIPFVVFAPYIPRPTGERLAEVGINFVDPVGNIHLKIGNEYHVLKLGLKQPKREIGGGPGAAAIQLQFVLLADPDAIHWPIRRLAMTAGIGKTFAAEIKNRLDKTRLITKKTILDRKRLDEQFLSGYGDFLRPRFTIGRYRAFEKDPTLLTNVLAQELAAADIQWALTGAAGGYQLEKLYRGETTTLFVADFPRELQHRLRLVPDPHGPVTLLRTFGDLVVWRKEPLPVAHPLLVYAELLHQGGTRDLEAANLVRENYLVQ